MMKRTMGYGGFLALSAKILRLHEAAFGFWANQDFAAYLVKVDDVAA